MVHYTGVGGDSSEEDKEDQEEWIEEAVSFQDILEQARAQSDIYLHCCIERERGPVARNCQVCQVARDLFLFGPIGSLAFVSSRSFL